MSKNWQCKLRKQRERDSTGMSTKSPDLSVGNTAATGMSPYEIGRGILLLLREDGSNISRKSSTDQHQKRSPRYQKLKRS